MRVRQLGLVEGPMLYVIIALGVALLASSGWAWVLSARLDGCNDSLAASRAMVKLQNESIDKLKTDGAAMAKRAEDARKAAATASLPQVREAARLRSEATKAREPQQPVAAGSCQPSLADKAILKVRGGL